MLRAQHQARGEHTADATCVGRDLDLFAPRRGVSEGSDVSSESDDEAVSPHELEARAFELEADALRLRARASRLRVALESAPATAPATEPTQMTRAEYAASRKISAATVGRLLKEGMPAMPVGSTVRIDPITADEWRRARGRRPTKAEASRPKPDVVNDVDVSAVLARSGFRSNARGTAA